MTGSETRLVEYMDGSKKRFVIPVYQRNYDWKTENCKQLFDDLVKVVRNKRKSHFFGSIVSVYNPDGRNTEFLVIDGQQRLTTVSLLLLAIYNLLVQGIVTTDTPTLSEQIYEDFLVDKHQPTETRMKLKPVKNDFIAFGKLFSNPDEYIMDSNLTVNYNYFYKKIQDLDVTVDELFDAICRLEIIEIRLNQDDNPQLIFESLNSTGVALSEGDKIRNFILMGLPTNLQNKYYEEYWNRIEVCTDYDVSAFIRDYLSVKQQTTPSMNKVYFTFKAYVEDRNFETELLLKELLAYAKWYQMLLIGGTVNKALNACIYRLNRLETTVTRPFFLEVLRLHSENKLTISEVAEIFSLTENYLFRRTICDVPTNALNKIFLLLHREIIRYDGTEENYTAKFKYALLSKKERGRFPDDTEFTQSFAERQVYTMNRYRVYILERFENFGTLEDKDIYRHIDAGVEDGGYSIEHIMPQHLTPAWRTVLGDDYEQIHEEWLHRIANLTLTAYNSKYSNNPFEDKKTMKNGFEESGLRMNQWIAKKNKWSLVELEERSQYLMNKALEIWKFPVTDFKPAEKQMDTFTLEDDINLTGRSIAKFSYKSMEQPVTSWVEMYESMMKILHSEDKSVLSKLAHIKNDNDISVHVSTNKSDLRGYIEIENGLYMERNTSTWLKISLLKRFFKLYGAEPSDLVFYLREDNDADEEALEGRFELRKRYWTYALDFIKKAHGENGSFANVNPSKDNWINGFLGISGFHICCVANFDSARVELYFGKSNKEANKNAFDHLLKYKLEIESILGAALVWNRNDDVKSSKIYCQLNGVSIESEADWMQMANFHSEWSKKFYDVIVPYLTES